LKTRKKCSLQELQSIIGLLNFACAVVAPGRAFLRRLIDLTIGLKKPHHMRRLTLEARADIQAWSVFIENFNGKALIMDNVWTSSPSLHLYTDSSNTGFGGYLKNFYFAETWTQNSLLQNCHITVKELFPIVLALEVWGQQLQNCSITFHTDNEAVAFIINKQSSSEKLIMRLVRKFVLITLKYNILFRALHIAGVNNRLADLLSRQQVETYLKETPWANPVRFKLAEEQLHI